MHATQHDLDGGSTATHLATLEPVRFGEFLRDRQLISDAQWLEALAFHWSSPRRRRIGATIVERGILPADIVEAEARAFHEDLDIVEVTPSCERTTVPSMPVHLPVAAF